MTTQCLQSSASVVNTKAVPGEMPVPVPTLGDEVRQFITFTVGREEYGVGILAVREIRGWVPESRLPTLPPHVRGIINLRYLLRSRGEVMRLTATASLRG